MVTFDEIWQKEFAPLLAAKRRKLAEHRTEAMLDVALTLCGEEVRQMSPHDMLHLDALGNPFICGSENGEVHFIDCVGFLWQLHVENNHTAGTLNLWRRAKMVRRVAALPLGEVIDALLAYVDRMLLDSGGGKDDRSRDPSGDSALRIREDKTHFLAPLLVEIAGEIGHIDPMSGLLLAQTPLPRLKQYQLAALERKETAAKVYTEIDSLHNRCMERVNQLNAALRSQISNPEISDAAVAAAV